MNLLIFAGAGTSIELGVPAMGGMATEFIAHSQQWNVEPLLVEKLMGSILDIEHLIESLDKICDARQPLQILDDLTTSLDSVDTVRSEVEWFVQHAAERIAALDANLMWGSVLRAAGEHELTFVTTNYDRGIELAANAVGITLMDGFEPFGGGEVARWIGFSSSNTNTSIIKLHGSTDWYSEQNSGHPLKLRHPMPLFGRGTLRLSNGEELGSALILPSREKILSKPPYPRLTQAFLNAVDSCDAAVFVGSSLRDEHIKDAAASIAMTRPVYIVNPNGNSLEVPHAKSIAQPASEFLVSTLPASLAYSEPLNMIGQDSSNEKKNTTSMLELLQIATNSQEHTDRRCEAIERLDQQSVTLGEHLISKLLSDNDVTVSRYALGLVATSPDRDVLLDSAKMSLHLSDASFAEELTLLEKIAGKS